MSGGARSGIAARLAAQYGEVRLDPVAGDASTRRFHRMTLADETTRVVMDYGAPFDGIPDDVKLAAVFREAGLPVARVLDIVSDPGFLVLEDLGDRTLESALADLPPGKDGDTARERLYLSATALAGGIARRGTLALRRSDRSEAPALDRERFEFEMDFFLENYAGRFLGRGAPSPELRAALHELAAETASHPRVMCHRDYHCRNLMVRPDGSLAMVDIQDARWGPDSYDLASLLRDAYVDVPEERVDRMIAAFLGPEPSPTVREGFRDRFDRVAAQRMIKALGTFGFQVAVRGNPRYADAARRTVSRLVALLPRTAAGRPLAALLEREGLLSPPA